MADYDREKLLKVILKSIYTVLGALFVGLVLYLAPRIRSITVEQLLAYTPKEPLLAVIAILFAYAVKSLLVFFPLLVLYVAVGTLFPGLWGLAVNLLGLSVCLLVPYSLGRWLGGPWLQRFGERNPKLHGALAIKEGDSLFFSFLLRAVNLLPGDIVSFLLGAQGVSLHHFLLGSLLGLAPVMIPATLLGQSLQKGSGGSFIRIAVSLTILIGISLVLQWWGRRKRTKLLEDPAPEKPQL